MPSEERSIGGDADDKKCGKERLHSKRTVGEARVGFYAKGKQRRSTEGAKGTNKGHENAEGMFLVGVRLTDQFGTGEFIATITLQRR